MLHYQVVELRGTINKMLRQEYPPAKVGIKREHAEYLGVTFNTAPPMNERRPSGLSVGVMYGSVVMVKLEDLYLALKDAVGVDYEDRRKEIEAAGGGPGQDQT